MFTYHQLGVIADTYIPIIFIVSMFFLAKDVFKIGFNKKLIELSSVIVSIFTVYIIMFLDSAFKIWPIFGLDYSTHTALSLVFVVYLSSKSKTLLVLSALSFLLYALLMIYQKYHTLADIVSTSVILIPIFWALLHKGIITTIADRVLKRTL